MFNGSCHCHEDVNRIAHQLYKGGLTATCPKAALQIYQMSGQVGAKPSASYRALGVDIAAGRQTKVWHKRSTKTARGIVLQLRLKRFRMIGRAAGAKATKLFTTGFMHKQAVRCWQLMSNSAARPASMELARALCKDLCSAA